MKSKFIMKLAAVCVSATMFATMMLPSISAIANTSITSAYGSASEILNLKTNNYTIPLTVEDANPVFSWEMDSNLIGQQQKAYQIVVTRDSDGKVVWDSGRVEGSQSNDVYYKSIHNANNLPHHLQFLAEPGSMIELYLFKIIIEYAGCYKYRQKIMKLMLSALLAELARDYQ